MQERKETDQSCKEITSSLLSVASRRRVSFPERALRGLPDFQTCNFASGIKSLKRFPSQFATKTKKAIAGGKTKTPCKSLISCHPEICRTSVWSFLMQDEGY